MNCLRVFESAGRLSSFSRAAEELGTHQPAVSRYIAELEYEIGCQLFERNHRSVTLTPAGERYHHHISVGLEQIAAGARTLADSAEKETAQVTIVCAYTFSYLCITPRIKLLRRALGDNIRLRIVTVDDSMHNRIGENEADLIITCNKTAINPENRVELFKEYFTPVCSPEYAADHADVLTQPVKEWGPLQFLNCSDRDCWATWNKWFEFAGAPSLQPRFINVEDYVCMLESAIHGQGLALGWRYYIDHYLSDGLLVVLNDGYVEGDRSCFAILTKRGCQRQVAHQCLEVLGNLKDEKPCVASLSKVVR